MEGAPRTVAVGAAIAALLALGAVLLLGGGPDAPAPEAAAEEVPAAASNTAPGDERKDGDGRKLTLFKRGNPIVWVKKGEDVELRSSPGGAVLDTVGDETDFGSTTVFAVFEVKSGWAGVPAAVAGNGNLAWVKLDGRVLNAGYTAREIDVDLSEFRAQLLINGDVKRTFTIATGAPATPTPTGRFAVTDTFRGDLNPVYGCCAVALTAIQPNLESGWLGGNLIAFHGTTGALGVPISHGCMRAADRDVSALVDQVPPGAPVVVHE